MSIYNLKEETSLKPSSFHMHLLQDGYIVKKDMLSTVQTKKLLKDLTVTPKTLSVGFGPKPTPFEIYKSSPNYYYIPRFYGIEIFGEPLKTTLSNGDAMSSLKFNGKLLDHQINATEKTYNSLNRIGGGLLSLPCGFGKTCISIYLAIKFGRKTGIVVNKEDLADQWERAIMRFTNSTARVGRIQQDIFDIKDKDFVICIVHTLSKRTFNKDDMKTFGMFIIDECHHLGSEMFSRTFFKINSKYMLGLSATPNRKDGLTNVINYYLGPLCHSEKRPPDSSVNIKKIKLNSSSVEYTTLYNANGNKNTIGMISKLTGFSKRNNLIVKIISELMSKEDRKIIVLSGIRLHLDTLKDLIIKENIILKNGNAVTVGFYRGNGGTSKSFHKKMLEDSSKCNILLATHHIASEGLDIPDLNCLIFATPMSEVEQSCGRILRKKHTINPVIIDIIDNFGNFVKQSYTRSKLYKAEKYNITTMTINLDQTLNTQSIKNFIGENIKNENIEEECSDFSENELDTDIPKDTPVCNIIIDSDDL